VAVVVTTEPLKTIWQDKLVLTTLSHKPRTLTRLPRSPLRNITMVKNLRKKKKDFSLKNTSRRKLKPTLHYLLKSEELLLQEKLKEHYPEP